jgi:hypothetical protein
MPTYIPNSSTQSRGGIIKAVVGIIFKEIEYFRKEADLLACISTTAKSSHGLISASSPRSGKRAVPQFSRLIPGFPPRRPGFEPRSGHVGFVVDKVALGQVFSEYFDFPCQFSFHRLLRIHHLSSGAGTIGQLVADVASGLSPVAPQETPTSKKKLRQCPRLDSYYVKGKAVPVLK